MEVLLLEPPFPILDRLAIGCTGLVHGSALRNEYRGGQHVGVACAPGLWEDLSFPECGEEHWKWGPSVSGNRGRRTVEGGFEEGGVPIKVPFHRLDFPRLGGRGSWKQDKHFLLSSTHGIHPNSMSPFTAVLNRP